MAVTWNPSSIFGAPPVANLSNGNLTVANASGTNNSVFIGNTGFSSGNLYFEFEATTLGTVEWAIGWGPLTNGHYQGLPPGYYSQGLVSYRNGAQVLTGGNSGSPIGTAPSIGGTPGYVGVAFQPSTSEIWFTTNGSTWNAGGGATPGGTGGYTGTGGGPGAWAAPFTPIMYCGSYSTGPLAFTANFGASAFHFSIPTGFTGVENPVASVSNKFFFQ